jgi:GNAT superfamily N-acetyltransferase
MIGLLGRPAPEDDPGPQRRAYLAVIGAPGSHVLLADLDGTPSGVAAMLVRPRLNWPTPEAWLSDLYVAVPARGRGVGRALVDACAGIAREAGCHLLRLEAGHGRREAHALYASLGFRHAGRDYQLALAP